MIRAHLHGGPGCGHDFLYEIEIAELSPEIEVKMTNGLQLKLAAGLGLKQLDPLVMSARYRLRGVVDSAAVYDFTGVVDGVPINDY